MAEGRPRSRDGQALAFGRRVLQAGADRDPAAEPAWSRPPKLTGLSEDEILAQVAEHARVDHGMESVLEELVRQVRAKITET